MFSRAESAVPSLISHAKPTLPQRFVFTKQLDGNSASASAMIMSCCHLQSKY